ncbi:hypothetical protein Q667_15785 [Marinobacter sp. C1S70]|uniref:Wzz/FepE/Etk N-terminal domain-containing protein n=1 Tax=Marinobacter sp. C1S70 TaxID=1396859 RepID=UPI0003B8ECE4|nr:Wzz/FepE/Etk N-terminal domain-containing protein [Marinobacter sp. C1S70]ERS87032.1 hypothetical protein Q667_15785 [Marinobacter sp. C1S70]
MNHEFKTEHCYPDHEIDLKKIFAALWRGRWQILIITILFAAAGGGYAFLSPNVYQSRVLVAPANEENSGLTGLASQFGGLASLAGISLGSGGSNKTVIAKELLRSHIFLSDFIRRHAIEPAIMAVEDWNERNGELVYDEEKYNRETSEWLSDEDGESHKPSEWELVEKFRKEILSVSESKETGMITIGVRHYSPIVAKQWAEWIIKDLNEYVRDQDIKEAEARVSYLKEKLDETNVAGMQQVFYQLIESEIRTVMLANAQEEYVFKTVDPSIVPEEKSAPKRALIIVVATMLGVIFSMFTVLIHEFLRFIKAKAVES